MNVLWAAWFISNRTFDRWRPGHSTRAWKEETDEGGILFDLGTHLVDQALVLFGQPAAVGAEVLRERDGEGSNDAITIRLHYFTGFSVTLGANCLSSLARPRFHLRGTRGNFWKWGLDPQEDALGKVTKIEDANWGQEPNERWGTLSVDVDGSDGDAASGPPHRAITGSSMQASAMFCSEIRPRLRLRQPKPGGLRGCLSGRKQSSEKQRDIECDWSGEPA